MTERSLTGGCLCGQVRYEARGPAVNVRACHCTLCRKAASAPFFARAIFLRDAVSRSGETLDYRSSPRLVRRSCARCGTLVFCDPDDAPARLAISLATLDDPNGLAPDRHIYTSTRLDWVRLNDGLPQHLEGAPA
jgi:hypothetical protein